MVAFRRRHDHREMERELAVVIQPARDQMVTSTPSAQRYLGPAAVQQLQRVRPPARAGRAACVHCGDLLTIKGLLDS
jgi:hypothetical protein